MENSEWKTYIRTGEAEMRPYKEGDDINGVSISDADLRMGSPKPGDMISRNPNDHSDMWLVAKQYFLDNFQEK